MQISAARRRKITISYAPDWLITLALAATFYSLDKVHGFRRQFSVDDTSLRHTFAVHERVPNWALYVICFVVPATLQPLVNLVTIRSWWDLHNSTLGLVLSLALAGSITQFTKITVGRPRPDILDRCQPLPGSEDPIYGLSNSTICQQTNVRLLDDGFRSFPSGHASMSFAGLGFLAFYLAGKLHLFDQRGHAGKAWLSLTPFSGAALVAISRTMDYRHHWQDVLVGSLMGTVTAYFAYRQYYPSLTSQVSHRPYSPRIRPDYDPSTLPLHYRSESGSAPRNGLGSISAPPVGGHASNQARYTDGASMEPTEEQLGDERTVRRPDPGHLHEVWKNDDLETQDILQHPL